MWGGGGVPEAVIDDREDTALSLGGTWHPAGGGRGLGGQGAGRPAKGPPWHQPWKEGGGGGEG